MKYVDNPKASELHASGVEACVVEKDLPKADELLSAARLLYQEDGNELRLYHIDRDQARVAAGLGSAGLRDLAIESAVHGHRELYDQDPGCASFRSELAASLHVQARICLARSVEIVNPAVGNISRKSRRHHRQEMAELWREAYSLIRFPGGNLDYRQQIVAHGALGLATFGDVRDMPLIAKLYVDPSLDTTLQRKVKAERIEAIHAAPKAVIARRIPVLGHKVKKRVAEKIAGPYIVK